ncbi:MAG: bifunctional UDP-sugar hydrolase/5'-nucleotidase [Candidatus Omnitrophota bacterium]
MIRKARRPKTEEISQKTENRRRIFWSFCLLFSVLCFSVPGYAKEVIILYTGQTHAMLYPCSCPIRQDGGISRRATMVKELRNKYPKLLLLDGGSFTAGGQLDEYTQNIQLDMQRSEVNYKALEFMQYDAVGISPDEFNFGSDFFLKNAKKANPAYLSVNLETDKVVPYIIKDSGGVKIAIIGLTGLSANQKAEGLKISAPNQINELVRRLKNTGVQVLIALSTQGESEDLKLISKTKGIDIIFVGDKPLKDEALTKIQATFILRPAWQGRKLGKLTLKIQDGKLSNCTVDELPVSDNLKDDSDIARILPRCYSDLNCKEKNLVGICQNPGALNAACLLTKPERVDLFVINVKDCVTCNIEPVINLLRKKFPGLIIKLLNYPGSSAQKMIKDLSLQVLPAYIFPRSVESQDNFESIKSDLQLINDFYLFKPQASGISYFLNQTQKKGNFDLFFNLFEKDATLLLTRMKEFKPSLHFLATENDQVLPGKNVVSDEEEYLRAVCVQKYYPEKFWDYLICRSEHIKSAYWEDCLGGLDAQSVKTCARGPEGASLFRENTSLNKQLKIYFGPSYLLNNQEIFSSRGVPGKEELRKILKK